MNKKYFYLVIVGIIGMIFVSLFGIKGMYSLNLVFLTPFIFNNKTDEREKIIINKNYSQVFGLMFLILINGYIISNFVEFGTFLLRNWVGLVVSLLFVLLGINGLRLLKKE
jgi:hypothetical protein